LPSPNSNFRLLPRFTSARGWLNVSERRSMDFGYSHRRAGSPRPGSVSLRYAGSRFGRRSISKAWRAPRCEAGWSSRLSPRTPTSKYREPWWATAGSGSGQRNISWHEASAAPTFYRPATLVCGVSSAITSPLDAASRQRSWSTRSCRSGRFEASPRFIFPYIGVCAAPAQPWSSRVLCDPPGCRAKCPRRVLQRALPRPLALRPNDDHRKRSLVKRFRPHSAGPGDDAAKVPKRTYLGSGSKKPQIPVAVITRDGRSFSPAAEAFVDILHKSVKVPASLVAPPRCGLWALGWSFATRMMSQNLRRKSSTIAAWSPCPAWACIATVVPAAECSRARCGCWCGCSRAWAWSMLSSSFAAAKLDVLEAVIQNYSGLITSSTPELAA